MYYKRPTWSCIGHLVIGLGYWHLSSLTEIFQWYHDYQTNQGMKALTDRIRLKSVYSFSISAHIKLCLVHKLCQGSPQGHSPIRFQYIEQFLNKRALKLSQWNCSIGFSDSLEFQICIKVTNSCQAYFRLAK